MSSDEKQRWIVETRAMDGPLHDVAAHSVEIGVGGSLIFRDENGDLEVAYAPHAWDTVTVDPQ